MTRLTWLLGPPGAGKSTFARSQNQFGRYVELDTMLAPLVNPVGVRKGVLSARGKLVEAVRAIELHPDNAHLPPLLVVAGIVPMSLFPLQACEEVWLLLPERTRWELQLRSRPSGSGRERQYDDFEYSALWYDRFREWFDQGLPMRSIEVAFDPALIGQIQLP